jgi:hypothetical protein
MDERARYRARCRTGSEPSRLPIVSGIVWGRPDPAPSHPRQEPRSSATRLQRGNAAGERACPGASDGAPIPGDRGTRGPRRTGHLRALCAHRSDEPGLGRPEFESRGRCRSVRRVARRRVGQRSRTLASERLSRLSRRTRRRRRVGPHAFPTVRGRHLRIARTDLEVHVDDELWTSVDADQGNAFEVTLRDRAWFLVPAQQASLTAWMRGASGRDLGQSERAAPARVTPSRWAWPGGGRARFHR